MKALSLFIALIPVFIANSQDYETITQLTPEQYNILLNQQFRSLLTSSSSPSVGSFAALDISDSKRVTFAPTFVLKKGNLIGAKFNAGISNGFAEIFNNAELNTNLSFDLEYNLLRMQDKTITNTSVLVDRYQLLAFERKKSDFENTLNLELVAIQTGQKQQEILAKLDTTVMHARFVALEQKKAEHIIGVRDNDASKTLSSQALDDLNDEMATITVKKAIAKKGLLENNIALADWIDREEKALRIKHSANLRTVKTENLTVYGFKFGWFTFGGQLKHDAFKLFEPEAAFPDRIVSETFLSKQLRLKYSFYQWMPDKGTYFVSAGLTYNFKSNYQDLTTVDVSIVTDYDTSGIQAMSTEKKYSAYVGSYRDSIDELILDFDFYYFFNTKNNFAFHVYPNIRFIEGMKTTLNAGIGILYPFKDAKKETSIVNVELYYNLIDIGHSTRDDFRLFKQNKIGLRFSFPITFKNP